MEKIVGKFNFELFEETVQEFLGSPFFANSNVFKLSEIGGLDTIKINRSEEGLELSPEKGYYICVSHKSDYLAEFSGNQWEKRSEIRGNVRKLFIHGDGCNIYTGLKQMLPKVDDRNFVIDIIKNPLGLTYALQDGDLPDNFSVDLDFGDGKGKKTLNNEYLDIYGMTSHEIYLLYLYGGHLHTDTHKQILYKALVKRHGLDKILLYIDTHMVILAQLFRYIIIPLIGEYKGLKT